MLLLCHLLCAIRYLMYQPAMSDTTHPASTTRRQARTDGGGGEKESSVPELCSLESVCGQACVYRHIARCVFTTISRVDKQECATPDLSCTICRYPRPRRNFLLTSPFFRETRTLPQSSVRARAGHRPCSVKPGQVHEGNLSKRLAARASSERLRQQKIPPWANPSASCTLLFIYS